MGKLVKKNDIALALSNIPFFSEISTQEITRLIQGCEYLEAPKGTRFFSQGREASHCYLVVSGGSKLAKSGVNLEEAIMCFCRRGDFFGAALMPEPDSIYPVTAYAVEETLLLKIPRAVYLERWLVNPVVSQYIHCQVSCRLREFLCDKSLSLAPVRAKIANFLRRAHEVQCEPGENLIPMRLTRKDIAARTGCTVETVIRTLKDWTDQGWIKTEGHRIKIENMAALSKIAFDRDA